MMLRPENAKRKVDGLGRITLPKGLRDRMFLSPEDELELFTMDYEGKQYICMASTSSVDPKYLAARAVLTELGADIPKELAKVCD